MIKQNSMNANFLNKPALTTLLAQLIIITVAMMFSFSANAASCKGLSKSSCSASSSCNWVNGYKRKDGVKVSGHCRSASGKANKDKKVKKDKKVNKTEKKTKKKTSSKKDNAKKKSKSKKDKKKKDKKKKDKSKKNKSKKDKDKKK